MRTSGRLFFWVKQSIKLVPLVVGIHCLVAIFQAFDIAERQPDWVTTQASVTQSRNSYMDDTKRCDFQYEYIVNDRQFINWRY